MAVPIPALNLHRGDVLQRQAERARAAAALRQAEVVAAQDVRAALARLRRARDWADYYRAAAIPGLERNLKEIRDMLQLGEAGGVNLLSVLDVQRKLLKARDGQLDARFEVLQALADLAAAVGDPSLAVEPCPCP
jgi:outer membrane protein TolC